METGPEGIGDDNKREGKQLIGHLQHQQAALKAWEAETNTDKEGKTGQDISGRQPCSSCPRRPASPA